jgi:prepilin-type N-terminal cleavage/methylation domain-containing protein
MVSKTPKFSEKGITLIEILITVVIISILTTSYFVYVNPMQSRAKARDNQRVSDISTLDRAITEYMMDNNGYPDTISTLRISTSLPGACSSLYTATCGWIASDISKYTSRMPTDPLNDAQYHYSYIHDATSYELNAVLEYYTDHALTDGGDNDSVYEVGNNKTLIH